MRISPHTHALAIRRFDRAPDGVKFIQKTSPRYWEPSTSIKTSWPTRKLW